MDITNEELIYQVMERMKKDMIYGDLSAIAVLLESVPEENLKSFLEQRL